MRRILLLLLALLFALSACGETAAAQVKDPEAQEKSIRYVESMDTFLSLTAYGANREAALDAAQEEILRLNDLLSIGVPTSEVAQINANGSGEVSEDTAQMIRTALALYESTDGAFDITILPLMQLWGFTDKEYRIPTASALEQTLALVGADRLSFDGTGVTLAPGQSMDLGGIAKGFTSQRIMELYAENGVTSGMVSLGGNVQCLGTKPDGSLWRVGIRDPEGNETSVAAVVEVADQAVITSGGYERYFTDESGRVYEHILNPKTGYPAQSGLSSVSIITSDGTLGDGLSTALYILGLEAAADYWREHSTEFEAILMDDARNVYITQGLEGKVTTQLPLAVIRP